MRKFIFLILLIALCVAGCANVNEETVETTTTLPPPETLPTGYYEPDSREETDTAGAVRAYDLPDNSYQWIAMAGDRVLLATESEAPVLSVLTGNDGVPAAQLQLQSVMLDTCQSLLNGFAYYNPITNEAVFLDIGLKQTQTIALPEGMVGTPIFASDGTQIYFCVGNELRAIEVERKLNRLVKTFGSGVPSVYGICFDGTILICNVETENQKTETVYVSADNGQTLKTDNSILELYSSGNSYLVTRKEGIQILRLTGNLNEEAKRMTMEDTSLIGVLDLGGIVGYNTIENGINLNYYEQNTGKMTASVVIPGVETVKKIISDKWGKCIWILASREQGDVLLRWDISASEIQDENLYVGTMYTAENPDTEALELLNERVEALNKKHGVRIRIWEDAVIYTDGHEIVPEHHVAVISGMLDELEVTLDEFPKKFVSKSISSKVRICLVRSIDGEQNSVQFWVDSYAFVTIAAGSDVRSEFLKGFGHVVDSHVLGNSPMYDYWNNLNPKEFTYGGESDETLAAGENRAFYDTESMKTGTIDRSRIFWQAMLPDNAEMFQSETMQAKLKLLCQAIRDAWRLEKEEEEYPWEQYLNQSIAYKKK